MIRSAIINYFKQLKYVFAGMGVIYLAVIVVIFAFFRGGVAILSDAASVSIQELSDYLSVHFQNVTLEILFSDGYLTNFLDGLLNIFLLNGENVLLKFFNLTLGLAAFVLFSMKAASFLMRRLIRRELSDGETKRGLLVLLFRFAASVLFLFTAVLFAYEWIYSVFLLLILFAVLKTFEQLFTTWFVYCRTSFHLREIFRIRHILNLLAANAVSIALNLAIVLLMSLVFNLFFAFLVAIPLIVYQFTVLDFTAVEYFNRKKLKTSTITLPQNHTEAGTEQSDATTKTTAIHSTKPPRRRLIPKNEPSESKEKIQSVESNDQAQTRTVGNPRQAQNLDMATPENDNIQQARTVSE